MAESSGIMSRSPRRSGAARRSGHGGPVPRHPRGSRVDGPSSTGRGRTIAATRDLSVSRDRHAEIAPRAATVRWIDPRPPPDGPLGAGRDDVTGGSPPPVGSLYRPHLPHSL